MKEKATMLHCRHAGDSALPAVRGKAFLVGIEGAEFASVSREVQVQVAALLCPHQPM